MMASSPYLAKADSVYIIRPENLLLVSAVQSERSIPIFLFSIQIILRFSEKNGILLKQITMSSRLLLMHNKKTRRIASFFYCLECKMLVEDLLRFLIIVTNYQDCVITRSQNQSIFGVFIIVVNRIKFKLGNAVLLSFFQ